MKITIKYFVILAVIALLAVAALMYIMPVYNVWQQEMSGKAEMAKAEQNRRILVEEARARLEAEKLNAQAEVERAIGMAEAMKVETIRFQKPIISICLSVRWKNWPTKARCHRLSTCRLKAWCR